MYEKGTDIGGAALGSASTMRMGRAIPTSPGPQGVHIPEIGAAMNNLENEVTALIEESERLASMLDGVLRPEGTQATGGGNEKDLQKSKAPIAEHADRIAMSVKGYRTRITRLIERVAL